MFVSNLELSNFRNHTYSKFVFSKGLNVLEGPNAVGKTNVAESIYYLSLARSFRTQEDDELIKKETEQAFIDATIQEGDIKRKIKVLLQRDRKVIFINGKPITKLSDLSKAVNVVLFEPKDVLLFKDSPRARRNFLDISISKKYQPYLGYMSRYEKVLKERNDILKNEHIDQALLDTTTEMLIKLSKPIIDYRQNYVKDINDILNKITRALTGENEIFKVCYKPFVSNDASFTKSAKEAFIRAQESDLRRKVTSIGIHREDISMSLNDRDIATYGSQGENRIAAIALKLAPYFLIEDKDKKPIVVLDDVMSELDQPHQDKLIKFLSKFEQVFITATKLEINGANHYQIKTNL